MTTNNYAFPANLGSGDDPFIGLIEVANKQYPGFIKRVVDGGAGVGSFVERVIEGSVGCNIVAYEPLPENAKVLRSRFAGASNVDIREAALGDKSTNVTFEVPERKGIPNSLWTPGTSYGGHVSRAGGIAAIKGLAKKVLKPIIGSREHESISVKMVRLDSDLNAAPDLVKLDLQGGEPEALEGLGDFLKSVKVAKIEIQMLSGDSRSRSVRLLKEAGFAFYVEDLQFSVPRLTDGLRNFLSSSGVGINFEGHLSPSDPDVMVKGSWPNGRALPIQDVELTRDFLNVLSESKASYFQVDLIALNGRYSDQWKSLLPAELVKHSGMS